MAKPSGADDLPWILRLLRRILLGPSPKPSPAAQQSPPAAKGAGPGLPAAKASVPPHSPAAQLKPTRAAASASKNGPVLEPRTESDPPIRDRTAYLGEIRRDLLRKMGLPPDTPPDQVMRRLGGPQRRMVPGKASILGNASAPSSSPKTAADARLELLRTTRARLLGNLRLPDRVKPSQVQVLLGLRRALDRLQSTALVLEQRRKKKK